MPERRPLSRNYRANPLTRLNLLLALIFKPWNMPITSSTCGTLEAKRRFEPIGEITLNGPMGWCGSWTVRIGREWSCVDKNWCVSCYYFQYLIHILAAFPASHLFTCVRFRRQERLLQQERLAGASLLVFANKQDMEGSLVAAEISKVLELHNQQYENRHWSIQSCSAVTGQGLVEGMDWLVEDISSRIFLLS